MRSCAVPALLALAAGLPALSVATSDADFGIQPVAIGAGARALGMGGAFSAVADDATAVTWNPAGLTQCERPEAAVSLGWYGTSISSQANGRSHDEDLALDHASGLLPFFAFGCMQVVGIAWQRQYDFSRDISWQEDYVDLSYPIEVHADNWRDSDGSFASLGLSYAIEPMPGLSFGVTVNAWHDALTGASGYHSDGHSRTETSIPGIDSVQIYDTTAEVEVASGWNLALGGFWQATPSLTLAVVLKPTYTLKLAHHGETYSYLDDGTTITESRWRTDTEVDLRHPSSLTLGAAWHQADRHILSADATVTRWSQYRVDDGSTFYSPIGPVDPAEFGDLWTLRLGYEYVAILPRAIVVPRVGMLMEDLPALTTAASSATVTDVDATRDRWWGATAGASLVLRRWVWDLGAQVRYGQDVGAGQFVAGDRRVDMLTTTVRLGCALTF